MHLVNPLLLHINYLCSDLHVECKIVSYYVENFLTAKLK